MAELPKPLDTVFPLKDLSNEILALVLSYIGERRLLCQLSKTSLRFNEIATPLLYQKYEERDHWPATNSRDTLLLMRTLLTRPDLASRIKKYSGHGEDSNTAYDPFFFSVDEVFEEHDWKRLGEVVKSINPDKDAEKDHMKSLREGNWDALMPVFLSLLSGVEHITFDGWGYDVPRFDAYLKSAAAAQRGKNTMPLRHALPKLRTAELGYLDSENGMSGRVLLDWMQLKSLRRIEGHMILDGDQDDDEHELVSKYTPGWAAALDLSHMEEISYSYSGVDPIELAYILRQCKNLKRLKINYGGCSDTMPALKPPRFLAALEEVKDTLEYLSFTEELGALDISPLEDFPLGSLSGFTKLKHLVTDARVFIGSNDPEDEDQSDDEDNPNRYPYTISLGTDLPPNLETFTISTLKASDCFNLLDNLTNYPSLRKLDIGWKSIRLDPQAPLPKGPSYHGDLTKSEVLEIFRRCADAGIKIKIGDQYPPYRMLEHWVDKERLSRGEPEFHDGTKIYTALPVLWPYQNWEKLCKEFECDPKTGWRWDNPPPEGWVLRGFEKPGAGAPTEWDDDDEQGKMSNIRADVDYDDDEDDDE